MSRFGDFLGGVVDSLTGQEDEEDQQQAEQTLPAAVTDPNNLVHYETAAYPKVTTTLPDPGVYSAYSPGLKATVNVGDMIDNGASGQDMTALNDIFVESEDPQGLMGWVRALSPGQAAEQFRDNPLTKDIDPARVDEILATAEPFSPEWNMAMQVKQQMSYDLGQAIDELPNTAQPYDTANMTLGEQIQLLNDQHKNTNQFYPTGAQGNQIPTIQDDPSYSQYSPEEIQKLQDQYVNELTSTGDQIAAIDQQLAQGSRGNVGGDVSGTMSDMLAGEFDPTTAPVDSAQMDALMEQRATLVKQYDEAMGAAIYLGLDPASLEEQAVEGSHYYDYVLKYWDAGLNHQKDQAGSDLIAAITGKEQDADQWGGQQLVNDFQSFVAENIGFRSFYDRFGEVLQQAQQDDLAGSGWSESQAWRDGALAAYEQGYNGYTGYRAVWEYAVGTLFTPADRQSMEITGDPFNLATVVGGAGKIPLQLATKAGNPKVARALWLIGKTMEVPEQAEVAGLGFASEGVRGWRAGEGFGYISEVAPGWRPGQSVSRAAAAEDSRTIAQRVADNTTGMWGKVTAVTPETSADNATGAAIMAAMDENYANSSALLTNAEVIDSKGVDNTRQQSRWTWRGNQTARDGEVEIPTAPDSSGHSAQNVNYSMLDEQGQIVDPTTVQDIDDPVVNIVKTGDGIAVRTEEGADTWYIVPNKYWDDYTKGDFNPVETYSSEEMQRALQLNGPIFVQQGSTAEKIATGATDGMDVTFIRRDGTVGKVEDGNFEASAGNLHSIEIGLTDPATGEMLTASISPTWVDPRRVSQTRKVSPQNTKRWNLTIYDEGTGAVVSQVNSWSYQGIMEKLDEAMESGALSFAPEKVVDDVADVPEELLPTPEAVVSDVVPGETAGDAFDVSGIDVTPEGEGQLNPIEAPLTPEETDSLTLQSQLEQSDTDLLVDSARQLGIDPEAVPDVTNEVQRSRPTPTRGTKRTTPAPPTEETPPVQAYKAGIDRMEVTESSGSYRVRTQEAVADSDIVTVMFPDQGGAGTRLTEKLAGNRLTNFNQLGQRITELAGDTDGDIRILIGGPGLASFRKAGSVLTQGQIDKLVGSDLLRQLDQLPDEILDRVVLVTGGQTGVDEAVLKATDTGRLQAVRTRAHLPKGNVRRLESGKDVRMSTDDFKKSIFGGAGVPEQTPTGTGTKMPIFARRPKKGDKKTVLSQYVKEFIPNPFPTAKRPTSAAVDDYERWLNGTMAQDEVDQWIQTWRDVKAGTAKVQAASPDAADRMIELLENGDRYRQWLNDPKIRQYFLDRADDIQYRGNAGKGERNHKDAFLDFLRGPEETAPKRTFTYSQEMSPEEIARAAMDLPVNSASQDAVDVGAVGAGFHRDRTPGAVSYRRNDSNVNLKAAPDGTKSLELFVQANNGERQYAGLYDTWGQIDKARRDVLGIRYEPGSAETEQAIGIMLGTAKQRFGQETFQQIVNAIKVRDSRVILGAEHGGVVIFQANSAEAARKVADALHQRLPNGFLSGIMRDFRGLGQAQIQSVRSVPEDFYVLAYRDVDEFSDAAIIINGYGAIEELPVAKGVRSQFIERAVARENRQYYNARAARIAQATTQQAMIPRNFKFQPFQKLNMNMKESVKAADFMRDDRLGKQLRQLVNVLQRDGEWLYSATGVLSPAEVEEIKKSRWINAQVLDVAMGAENRPLSYTYFSESMRLVLGRDLAARHWAIMQLAGPQYTKQAQNAFRDMVEFNTRLGEHEFTHWYPVNYRQLIEAAQNGDTGKLESMAKRLAAQRKTVVEDLMDRLMKPETLMGAVFDGVSWQKLMQSDYIRGNTSVRRLLAAREARSGLDATLNWESILGSLSSTVDSVEEPGMYLPDLEDLRNVQNGNPLYDLLDLQEALFDELIEQTGGSIIDSADIESFIPNTEYRTVAAQPIPGDRWTVDEKAMDVVAARSRTKRIDGSYTLAYDVILKDQAGTFHYVPLNASSLSTGRIKVPADFQARFVNSAFNSPQAVINSFMGATHDIPGPVVHSTDFRELVTADKEGWSTWTVPDEAIPDYADLGVVQLRTRPNNAEALEQYSVLPPKKGQKVGYAGTEQRVKQDLRELKTRKQWIVQRKVVDPKDGLVMKQLTAAEMENFEVLEVKLLGPDNTYKGGLMAQVLVPKGMSPGASYKKLLESWVEEGVLHANEKAYLPAITTNYAPQRISLIGDDFDAPAPAYRKAAEDTPSVNGRKRALKKDADARARTISQEVSALDDAVDQVIAQSTGFGKMKKPRIQRDRAAAIQRSTEFGEATVRSDVERFGKALYEALTGQSWDDAQTLYFMPQRKAPKSNLPKLRNEDSMRKAQKISADMGAILNSAILSEHEVGTEIASNANRKAVKITLPFDSSQQQTLWNTRLNGNTGYGRLTHGEVIEQLLEKHYGDAVNIRTATPQQIASIGGKLNGVMRADMGIPEASGMWKYWDNAARFTQENMLVGGLGAAKYLFGNQLIGTTTQAMFGKQLTFAHMGNPVSHFSALYKQVLKGGLAVDSPAFNFANDIGAVVLPDIVGGGAFADTLPARLDDAALMADDAKDPGSMMGRLTEYTAQKQKGALGWALKKDPQDSKFISWMDKLYTPGRIDGRARAWILRSGHSIEQAQRTAATMGFLKQAWGEARIGQEALLKDRLVEKLVGSGIDGTRADMYAEKIFAQLGKTYSPDELRELVYSVGRIESRAGNITPVSWSDGFGAASKELYDMQRKHVTEITDLATKRMESVMFNWDQRNIDKWAGRFIPFWRYYSRALPYYMGAMVRNPELAYAYHNTVELLNETAEEKDWPSWMKNYLGVMNGPGGMFVALNPAAALGLFSFFMAESEFDDEGNKGLVGQFYADVQEKVGIGGVLGGGSPLNLMPFTLFPMAITGLMGDQNQYLDPFSLWSAAKLVDAAVNFAGSRGYLPGDVDPRGRPLEGALAHVREVLSGVIPGVEQVEYVDPAVNKTAKIRWLMLDTYLQEYGWDSSDLQAMWTSYLAQSAGQPADATLASQFVDMMDTLSQQADVEGGHYWDEAEDRLYTGQLQMVLPVPVPMTNLDSEAEVAEFLGMAAAGTLMGPKLVEPALMTENRIDRDRALQVRNSNLLADSEFLTLMQANGVPKEQMVDWMNARQGLAYFLRDYGYADQRALDLIMQDQAYRSISGSEADELQATVQQIRNGQLDADSITVGGVVVNQQDLASLSFEQRYNVAQLWLYENDPEGVLTQADLMEQGFEETHPAYKGYRTWQTNQRKAWEDNGGAEAYRSAVSVINPGAKKYYEEQRRRAVNDGLSGQELQDKMAQVTWSLDAYMASYGIEGDARDPYKGNSQIPAAPAGASTSESTTSDNGGPITIRTLAEALKHQTEWNAVLEQQFGTGMEGLTPPQQAALQVQIQQLGLTPPADLWIAEDYQAWQGYQLQHGQPADIASYLIMLESTNQRPGDWQPRRIETYMPGGWSMTAQTGMNDPAVFGNDVNRNYTAAGMGQSFDGEMGPYAGGMGQRITGGGGGGGMGQRTTSVSMR